MTDPEIAAWFGLRRPNYIINPSTDAEFYAPRSRVNIPQIVENLRINLVTDVPPKRLFWGLYGGGKTHTLYKVAQELEKLLPIRMVYVECPNVNKRSTFLHLYHDGILKSMGQDFVVSLFERLVTEVIRERGAGRLGILEGLREIVQDEELSRLILCLVGADADRKLLFWKFISGVEVPKGDLATLGQTQDLTSAQPAKLAEIIIVIGKVVRKIHNQTLLIVLDELDRLQYVGDETGSTFEDAFRKLTDDNQLCVSILMGCSAGTLKELPAVFGGGPYGPVLSRIGNANLIEIPQIQPPDIDEFIKAIIKFVRNDEMSLDQLVGLAKKETQETIDPEFFPFSIEAIDKLKTTLRGIMTPREVTQRLTHAAGKAFLMQRRAATQDAIS